eukprot:scaffold5297_cov108-Skeletonema_marinoi.AAC.2
MQRVAPQMGAQSMIELEEKECVLDMGQRRNDAAVKGAQIKLKMEECVMCKKHGARSKLVKAYLCLCSAEGCTNIAREGGVCSSMGQLSNYLCAVKDA